MGEWPIHLGCYNLRSAEGHDLHHEKQRYDHKQTLSTPPTDSCDLPCSPRTWCYSGNFGTGILDGFLGTTLPPRAGSKIGTLNRLSGAASAASAPPANEVPFEWNDGYVEEDRKEDREEEAAPNARAKPKAKPNAKLKPRARAVTAIRSPSPSPARVRKAAAKPASTPVRATDSGQDMDSDEEWLAEARKRLLTTPTSAFSPSSAI